MIEPDELAGRCDLLRSLHVPGNPLVLPNAWDAATARAVLEAGFPVVATTSAGVAATLGYEDHEAAPADEMLGAAARIARSVDVPVTVDAEAGYGMEPAELVSELLGVGAAGCNLEDTDHAYESLRDPAQHAAWLRGVREAASDRGYGLVINARIDVFLSRIGEGSQADQLAEALERARAYVEAGVDCVYPIALWEEATLREFVAEAGAPVNALAIDQAPSPAELAELGVARISYGGLLYWQAAGRFADALRTLAE
jgi:2-methylisocitrate lyase-like PEP mutase family enzyme